MGISGHVNKSNLTEIRETGCQRYTGSGGKWSKGIKREKSESELLENQELCAFPGRMEPRQRVKRGWKQRVCRCKDPKKICRDLECAFNSLLFLPLSCLNNFRLSDQRQKSSILELAHAELL